MLIQLLNTAEMRQIAVKSLTTGRIRNARVLPWMYRRRWANKYYL